MRRSLPIAFCLVLAALAGSALAASGLKATMKSWKTGGTTVTQMATGKMAVNEADLRRVLEGFVTDTQALTARINANTAQGKDIKARFARFEADSTAALAALGQKDQLKGSIATVMGNCRSCHDVYAN